MAYKQALCELPNKNNEFELTTQQSFCDLIDEMMNVDTGALVVEAAPLDDAGLCGAAATLVRLFVWFDS